MVAKQKIQNKKKHFNVLYQSALAFSKLTAQHCKILTATCKFIMITFSSVIHFMIIQVVNIKHYFTCTT